VGPKSVLVALVLGLAACCGACSSRPSQGVLLPVAESVEGTSRVPLLVATTRRRSTTDAGEMFSGERAENVSFAAITVSLPPDSIRKVGSIQWPASLPGDPRRDFVTVSADYLDRPAFDAAITASTKRSRKVVVFVHGFNNRFDDAVYRFAQVTHDSKIEHIPVLFTWPSKGELALRAYTYDRESANYSRDALEELLDMLARHPGVSEVTIVAHSMGNWVTLEALRTRSIRAGRIVDKIKRVFLVAPDVDVDVFRMQIARMGAVRPQFALIVSQDDQALRLSQEIWGGKPRLGDVNPTDEPYRSEFERQRIEVFDLTRLKSPGDDAHDRAFEDITSVMAMIRAQRQPDQKMIVGPN
jgi:esterase/lipase superfamily enzyme